MHRTQGRRTLQWSVVAVALGLALSAWAKPTVIPVADTLKPALRQYCANLERVAAGPKLARVDAADRATVVMATVNESDPALEAFLGQISKLPPADRLESLKRSISAALGTEWKCAKLDELWNLK
jgi:hypothetical protein